MGLEAILIFCCIIYNRNKMTQKGIVYRLYTTHDDRPNCCYIGSTTLPLQVRLDIHKSSFNKWVKNKINPYCSSYKVIEFDNFKQEILEEILGSKEELLKAEAKWIGLNESRVNKNIPNNFKRYGDYKDYFKDYHINNRDDILAKKANRSECECGMNVRDGDRCRHLRSDLHLKRLTIKLLE